MKFVVSLLAVIGLCLTAPSVNLEADLLDFVELIPSEDIKILMDKHLRNDNEFQAAIQYLQSDEFENLITNLDGTDQAQEVKKYLLNAGIDVDFVFAVFDELLSDITIKTHHNKKSVKKFLEEVRTLIPYGELLKLYEEKIKNSTYFQEFVDKLTSERFHKLIEDLLATSETQQALDGLESIEVDIRNHIKAIYAFIGWKSSNYL